jgi:Uma2 family endonuclease
MAVDELVSEQISAAQYLRMAFEHYPEFVDGRIVERGTPDWEHSCIQGFLLSELQPSCRKIGFFVVPEQTLQLHSEDFRIPDVCIVGEAPEGPFVTQARHLCVEILSSDDRVAEMFSKIRDYLHFGTEWGWVVNPLTCTGQIHRQGGVTWVENGQFFRDRFRVALSKCEF